jgi:tetraacyldisaccharide 4'-kinase
MSAPAHWQHRNLKSLLLLPLAALFAAIAALRRLAWRHGLLSSRHPGVPVIVVGNITAGGTGKTPLVLWLAQFLQSRGMHPAIISRGHGSRRREPRAVPADGAPADFGDEPCLLALRAACPVWVGVDRAATAAALRAAHPEVDVIVSDDGLQHYRLARDFEIAVIDGMRGLGNGWPLPAGPLREPPSRLATVDAVVINDGATALPVPGALSMRLRGSHFRNLVRPQQLVTAADLGGTVVHAVAGIGNPRRFFGHLRELGLECIEHPFPDHHPYCASDLVFGDGAPVVMTEKDAVKCAAFANENQWALIVDADVDARLGDLITALLPQAARHG